MIILKMVSSVLKVVGKLTGAIGIDSMGFSRMFPEDKEPLLRAG